MDCSAQHDHLIVETNKSIWCNWTFFNILSFRSICGHTNHSRYAKLLLSFLIYFEVFTWTPTWNQAFSFTNDPLCTSRLLQSLAFFFSLRFVFLLLFLIVRFFFLSFLFIILFQEHTTMIYCATIYFSGIYFSKSTLFIVMKTKFIFHR